MQLLDPVKARLRKAMLTWLTKKKKLPIKELNYE